MKRILTFLTCMFIAVNSWGAVTHVNPSADILNAAATKFITDTTLRTAAVKEFKDRSEKNGGIGVTIEDLVAICNKGGLTGQNCNDFVQHMCFLIPYYKVCESSSGAPANSSCIRLFDDTEVQYMSAKLMGWNRTQSPSWKVSRSAFTAPSAWLAA